MTLVAAPFTQHMDAVARRLWGDPNPRASTASDLRWGEHGSRSVDLESGVFFDHEAKVGGGVLDLIARETGARGPEAIDWLRRELGVVIEDDRRPTPAPRPGRRIVATYDYVDEEGDLLLQVVRYEPKEFRQRRPDPLVDGGWNWSVKGVRQVPYRLPDLIEAVAREAPVFVVEGEKDVDALAAVGIAATCNAGGAGKWPATFVEHLVGADVIILPDNDDAGRNHRDVVAGSLRGAAARVRVLDLPDLPPKGDVSDWLAAGGDAQALYRLVDTRARPWTAGPPQSRFGAIQWADLDRVEVRQDYLVEDIIFQGDTGLIYGESGSGKSFLAVDMGLAIARGVPFLGKATAKGAVIYQAGEGGKGLLKRLRAYRDYHRIVTPDLPFVLLPERVDLFSDDGDTQAFIEECLAWKATLPDPLAAIFIDTFSAASPGANENASEDMSRLIKAGQDLAQATGAAVLWVHHKNAAGERERGHTSFRANSDTALEVNRDPETNLRTLRLAKLKDGEDGLKIGFELQSVTIGSNDDGKPITSCVVVPAQEESSRTGKRTRLPPGQFKFLKLLDDAILHRGGIMPPQPRIPPNTYGVEWQPFRDLYIAASGRARADNDLRKALSRDGDLLCTNGLIDRDGDWLWITEKGTRCLIENQ
jgi:hypothetical protein